MPRPRITKNVHGLPRYTKFGPLECEIDLDIIIMNIEEYESIRLIDDQGLNQKECAEIMGIGRTTAQRIYNSARKKLADCFIEGKTIIIDGGTYKLTGNLNATHNCCRGNHGNGKGRNRLR